MIKQILVFARKSMKLTILIAVSIFLIICGVALFFKPIYAVTINGEAVGYSKDKTKLQAKINTYIYYIEENAAGAATAIHKANMDGTNDEIVYEEHSHEEENHDEHDENEEQNEHIHSASCDHQDMYDGHIWQSTDNAVKMLENTLNAICKIDPENAEYYKSNYEKYKNEILKLDTEIEEIVENSEQKEIAVGGEFAYSYFVEQYDLKFVSVYTNCGHGEDPSIAKVKSVIDYINI